MAFRSLLWSRPCGRGVRRQAPASRCHLIERLEHRTLLSVSLFQPIGNQVFSQDSGAESADLTGVFFDTNGQSDLTFSATSTNPSVVAASVSGSNITLTPQQGKSGFAVIHLTAAAGGSAASNAFRVQITASTSRSLDVSLGPKSKSFTFAVSNKASAIVMLKGPGSAVAHMGGDALKLFGSSLHGANQELEGITLTGTTAASSLVITGRGANRFSVNIGNLSSDGALGTLQVKGAALLGDVSVSGGIHQIRIDSAQNGSIDAGSSSVTVQGKSFVDENFTSTGTVRGLSMGQWLNSDDVPEAFSAAGVQKLTSAGGFQPGVQLTGVLGTSKVRGAIGGTWNVGHVAAPLMVGSVGGNWNGTFGALPGMKVAGAFDGSLTAPSLRFLKVGSMLLASVNLTAAGANDLPLLTSGRIVNSAILTAGSIGKVETSQLAGSLLYAGLRATVFPASPSDFATAATIGSVILRGKGRGISTLGFDGAFISATNLGTLSLGTTKSNNGGLIYGIAARSIGRLTVKDTTRPQTISLNAVHDPATLAAQLAAQKVQLGDLTIRII